MSRIVYARYPVGGSVFAKTTQTFPEFLSDPLTQALMAADGVDVVELEVELREVAARLATVGEQEHRCSAC